MTKDVKNDDTTDTKPQTDVKDPDSPATAVFTVRLPDGRTARGGCRLDVTDAGEAGE